MQEIIIDKKTVLWRINNKDNYSKMILKYPVKSRNLKEFKNIKTLVVFSNFFKNNDSELLDIPFIENIEELIFEDKKTVGYSFSYLTTPNLKTIEFSDKTKSIRDSLFIKCKKLEKIIFNISDNYNIKYEGYDYRDKICVKNTNLKSIILNKNNISYKIDLDYDVDYITEIKYSSKEGIVLEYKNSSVSTKVNIINNNITQINTLYKINEEYINDNCLNIPSYINNINLEGILYIGEIKRIFLDKKILSSNEAISEIHKYLPGLESITLKNDNDMALFNCQNFTENELGKFNDVYIESNKLIIELDESKLVIDENGNKEYEKIESKEKRVKAEEDVINIENCSAKKLEYLMYYKKICELINCNNRYATSTTKVEEALKLLKKELKFKLDMED